MVGMMGHNFNLINKEAKLQQSLVGASRAHLVQVIHVIANHVEDAVAKVVVPPQAAWATADGACALHAAVIKQVHHMHRKMDAAKQVDSVSPKTIGSPTWG